MTHSIQREKDETLNELNETLAEYKDGQRRQANLNEVSHNIDDSVAVRRLSHRAQWIKTGNALYDDIEYYEYIIPRSSSRRLQQSSSNLPPRTSPSQSSSSNRKKKKPLSDFARSAYLTATPL
jgi:hypothetical protein